MTNLSRRLYAKGQELAQQLPQLYISEIILPSVSLDAQRLDEFGFIILNNLHTGPFYVSLHNTLSELWERYPEPSTVPDDVPTLLAGLLSQDVTQRALAIGTYNAISHAIFTLNPDCLPSFSAPKSDPSQNIGMVGHFDPLIDRLIAKGSRIFLLEDNQQRVKKRRGLELVSNAEALNHCGQVICTASTIINNSLEDILGKTPDVGNFQLIGPTASGYPTPYFETGVDTIGGVFIEDATVLKQTLMRSHHFSKAGTKFNLSIR